MPYSRPKLSDLRTLAAQQIVAALPGADSQLQFSNLKVLADVQAGLAHMHFGYLDWIANQSNPFTATDEFLAAWGAMKNVTIKPATQARGNVTFPASPSSTIPPGASVTRSDGTPYSVIEVVSQNSTSITVKVIADADPSGLTGSFGNCQSGQAFTLAQSIAGITSSGTSGLVVGGADLETQEAFRARVLTEYQRPPQGGASGDYEEWALQVPGVTRAWCVPMVSGPGTVGVYVMMDSVNATFQGVPQGANGVASLEGRDTAGTGDQLTVANYIFPLRPVTALVYVLAPTLTPINMSIAGINSANRPAVQAALAAQIVATGSVGGRLELNNLWAAIHSVQPSADFVIGAPSADVVMTSGHLPVLGTITWS